VTWRQFTLTQVEAFCHERGSRTFTLGEFLSGREPLFRSFAPNNRHVTEKIRQTLQKLRDDAALTFVDGRGTYTLRTVPLLRDEVQDDKEDFLRSLAPEKREYLIEVFARDRGWVTLARRHYGDYCLFPKCTNTFITERGTPYIEVHHIIPLYEGGEEALWNLSVVCAHHHRMSHFANVSTRREVAVLLTDIVRERYTALTQS
jgi:hypothetical protein